MKSKLHRRFALAALLLAVVSAQDASAQSLKLTDLTDLSRVESGYRIFSVSEASQSEESDTPILTDSRDWLVADAADAIADHLRCDAEIEANPELYFDRVIEIDLSALKPHYNGPFSPDRSFVINDMEKSLQEFGSPETVSAALIGSCTNSSYEDLYQAAGLIKQAIEKGLKPKGVA